MGESRTSSDPVRVRRKLEEKVPKLDLDLGRYVAIFAVAITIALLILLASTTTLWDRDEPRFARAAVEMLRGGDWLAPHFNTEIRDNKPVLIYWLMASSVSIFGVSEFAVRLPSILCMAGSVWLTYAIGRRLRGSMVGGLAAVIFATMVMPVYIGSAATADSALLLGILVAMRAIVEMASVERALWKHAALLCAGLAWAQLAKGPVGLMVPLLTAIGAWWMLRRSEKLAGVGPVGTILGVDVLRFAKNAGWMIALGTLGSIAVFLAWLIPADIASDGRLAGSAIRDHLLGHVATSKEGHGGGNFLGYLALLPVHIASIFAGVFPWSHQLLASLWMLWRRRSDVPPAPTDRVSCAILIAWIGLNLIFFSLWATKLPHYILPILPGVAIAIAMTIPAHAMQMLSDSERGLARTGAWVGVGISLAVIAAVVFLAVTLDGMLIWMALVAVGVPMAVFARWLIPWQGKEKFGHVTALAAFTAVVTLIAVGTLLYPSIGQIKASRDIAMHIQSAGLRYVPVYTCGYAEPSLVFYLNQPPDMKMREASSERDALLQWSKQADTAVLVITQQKLDDAGLKVDDLQLTLIATQSTLRYAGGARRQTILVLRRD